MIVPVILAGGSGTRLWPLSRELYPKQLMSLVGEKTMLQGTVARLAGVKEVADPIIICNDNHRFMVAEQLRIMGVLWDAIVLEPVGRNTAPAIAVAALKILEKNREAVLLVLPADHFIENIPVFQEAVEAGRYYASMSALITFGIVPTAPETGYGYIKRGGPVRLKGENSPGEGPGNAAMIESFVEKPDLQTAKQYLESGQYFWNSGMFMFRADKVLEELERFSPDIVSACRKAVSLGKTDLDFFRLDKGAFEECPSDSIDYAVMEKTDSGVVIPLDAGWNDLGSWEALWNVGKKDENSNVLSGDVITHDVADSYIRSGSRLVAAVGLSRHVVVETPDAVLVSHRDRVQDVKSIVSKLKSGNRREAISHKIDYRPWGSCETLIFSERFYVNHLLIRPGQKISLQRHEHRAEHWVIIDGTALVTRGEETFTLTRDQSVFIPAGVAHRLENRGDTPLDVIEVQTGNDITAADIARMDDAYGRE